MKRKYGFVALMTLVIIVGSLAIGLLGKKNHQKDMEEEGQITIVTSFYPMYISTKNITKGMEGVVVKNLASQEAGCLHDYQLSTKDMETLSKADVFVIQGGGVESFLEKVITSYPDLKVIDASKGQEFLKVHGEVNGHVWMDIDRYREGLQIVADEMGDFDPTHQKEYQENRKNYDEKLASLEEEEKEVMEGLSGEHVILFHDAFYYPAVKYGMVVDEMIDMDENTSLSAGQMAEIVDKIKENNIRGAFVEESYKDFVANGISNETDVHVQVLDPLIWGDGNLDSYIIGTQKNLQKMKEVYAHGE